MRRITPSNASRWVVCTAQPMLVENLPKAPKGQGAENGTAAHWVAEELIREGLDSTRTVGYPTSQEKFINTAAPNGVLIDAEIFESAWSYAGDVVQMARRYPNARVEVEMPISAPTRVHPQSEGVVDAFLYHADPQHPKLIVWDFKHGRSPVEVEGNWQLIWYVAGILDTLNIDDVGLAVDMRIVQPRSFHNDGVMRAWRLEATELRPHMNTLRNKAHEAFGESPIATAGGHCHYCPAVTTCKTAMDAGFLWAEFASKPTRNRTDIHQKGQQLHQVKQAIEQLKALEIGLEWEITLAMEAGEAVTGWTLKPTKANRSWAVPQEEVAQFAQLMGVQDPYAPRVLKTPARMEEALHRQLGGMELGRKDTAELRAVAKQSLSTFTEMKSGGVKLAPIDTQKIIGIFK